MKGAASARRWQVSGTSCCPRAAKTALLLTSRFLPLLQEGHALGWPQELQDDRMHGHRFDIVCANNLDQIGRGGFTLDVRADGEQFRVVGDHGLAALR